jgi:hypothetical protein
MINSFGRTRCDSIISERKRREEIICKTYLIMINSLYNKKEYIKPFEFVQ